jgi:hypothetical protein
MAEQPPCKRQVVGSIPTVSSDLCEVTKAFCASDKRVMQLEACLIDGFSDKQTS